MENCNMAKDIVQEAVEQAEAMKEAAYENAKSVLVDAMSTNLKAAVTEAIGEKIEETGNPKGADLDVQYDPSGQEKLHGDDLTDEGDGPAIIEAGLEEELEEEEVAEMRGMKKAAMEMDDDEDDDEEDDVDIDIDIDADDDDEDDEDMDEVLEIIEDEDEDTDEGMRMKKEADDDDDMDEGDDEDMEERGMMMKKMEASIKENRFTRSKIKVRRRDIRRRGYRTRSVAHQKNVAAQLPRYGMVAPKLQRELWTVSYINCRRCKSC